MRNLQKAQVSLEFILVLLAFLAVFSAILPFSSRAFHAGIFALDCVNAKNFSDSIETAVLELKSLGNNSSISVSANPSLFWKLFSRGKELVIAVESAELSAEKSFSVFFPNGIIFEESFDSKKNFLIRKSENRIFLEVS